MNKEPIESSLGEVDLGSFLKGFDPEVRISLGLLSSEFSTNLLSTKHDTGDDEDEDSETWQAFFGPAGSWMAHVRVQNLGSSTHVDLRLSNRTCYVLPIDCGVVFKGASCQVIGQENGWIISNSQKSVLVKVDGASCIPPEIHQGRMLLPFLPSKLGLGPRQCLELEISLTLLEARIEAFCQDHQLLTLQANDAFGLVSEESLSEVQVSVLKEDETELSAVFDFVPHEPIFVRFESLGGRPKKVAALSKEAEVFAQIDFGHSHRDGTFGLDFLPANRFDGQDAPILEAYHFSDLNNKVSEAVDCTLEAFKRQDYEKAALYAEQQLLFNGNDPLAWWELAVAQRHMGQDAASALANAHFLAPHDPLLRAESILGAGPDLATGLVGLLQEFEEHLEPLRWASACYLERGLWQDAATFLTNVHTVKEDPITHLLLAYCYINGTTMKTQAAEHYQGFVKLEIASNLTGFESAAKAQVASALQL